MTDKLAKKKLNKRAPPKKTELTPALLILIDLISIIFSLMPSTFAYSITGLFIYHGYATTWLVLPLAPFVLFAAFIGIVACLRLSIPSLTPGRHKRELSKALVAWYCHLALSRAAKITGLIPLLQTFNFSKFLYWRALGAKVSYNITNSFDIDLVDCPLITIGKGVTLASQTSLSCHSDIGNYLFLAPVVIEDDVFISMSNVIGPGTTIKTGAWIGFGNAFVNQVVEENEKVPGIRPSDTINQ